VSVQGTEDPAETWQPRRMAGHGTWSMWPKGVYADPVIEPVQEPFNRGLWPNLY
jgi:hypothetical protein